MDLELTRTVAKAVGESSDLETLARPLLDVLHRLTGLDTTYLTEVDEINNQQSILFSKTWGGANVPEGLVVDWEDTLCRRALETGTRVTDDVPNVFPGSAAAQALGLQTYVSVPITDNRNIVMGTLCGASGEKKAPADDVMIVMELFARLIADQWERDEALALAAERAEVAETRLHERAMFIAESEHKLKSPLTIIKGWSTLLEEDGDSMSETDRTKAITRIKNASETLAVQIDDMIEEARGVSLSKALDIREIDLGALMDRVQVELSGLSRLHTVSVLARPTAHIASDETALWHIFSHLGENSIKYSPTGGQVWLNASKDGDGITRIEVFDDGPGLPEGVDVFDPFVRGTTEIAGTGLGLHIVKTLVLALKGEIGADLSVKQGAKFVITLPPLKISGMHKP